MMELNSNEIERSSGKTAVSPDRATLETSTKPNTRISSETGKQDEVRKSMTAHDWNGPDDPDNPRNWPLWQRVYHTTVPALFAFTVLFGSSVYTPGIPEVMRQFNVSSTVAILPLSLYVLGLAFGPILAAPISETMGRRVVYLVSLPTATLFTLGAGFSQNIAALCICRFFAGFFESPVLAVGGGTNVDTWRPEHRAAATSWFLLAPLLGPALGPAAGGFAIQNKGWRWSQWITIFLSVPVYMYSLRMKETYKKIILQNRAKQNNIPPPARLGPSGLAGIKFLFTVTLFRPIYMICHEPLVFFMSLYTGFNFSVLFGFFDAFPIVFRGQYYFNSGLSGLAFLGIGLGTLLGVVTAIIANKVWYLKEHVRSQSEGRAGVVAPEHRLYAAMLGSIGLPIGLFWFAWSARADVPWISPILATIPFGWGNLCIFTSTALYLVDVYGPMTGASALAANGLIRYVAGAVFPLFTTQMYQRLGIAWATSLLGFVTLAMLPIPWYLFKYGPRLRMNSNFDTINA